MKRSIFAAMLLCLTVVEAFAQGPNNSNTYYRNADGLKGSELKTAMFNIIKLPSTAPISYTGLWAAYAYTDKRSDGYLRDWYSNTTSYVIGGPKEGVSYQKEGDSYNREHLVPQSWFNEAAPMKSDIMHVVPTDGYVNGRRSNYVLAEVGTATYTTNNGYGKLGPCKTAGGSGTVFEPNDEVKGDIARIYFYMATSYQDKITNWGGGLFTGTTYQPFADWYLTMLMRWSKNDPVDAVEIARNNAIYTETKQKNRNPFVDYPGLEDYIWGDKVNETFSYDNYNGTSTFVYSPTFTPADGMSFTETLSVTLACQTSGATIYYTTDGSTPSATNGTEYTDAITLTETTTIKAIAYDGEGNSSNVATASYTLGSGDTPTAEGTFIFNTDEGLAALGITKPDGGKGVDVNQMALVSGGVTMTSTSGSTATRVWNSSGNTDLRIYSGGGSLTFTSETPIVKIEFTSPNNSLNYIGVSSGTWTGESKSVTFTATGTARINTITVTLKGEMPEKQDVTLEFSETAVEATLGETFTAPTLSVDPIEAESAVVYSSSDESVATVDASTGEVTLAGEGTATITAAITGSDSYNDASASYELTVVNSAVNPSEQVLLYESFSRWTSGNEGGNIELTPTNTYLDYNEWSSISKVFPGANGCGEDGTSSNTNGCGKFGSGSYNGTMTTGNIALTGNGCLTFMLKKYGSDASKLTVTITGATTEDATVFSSLPTEWKKYTINLTEATGQVTLSFASTKRIYIDDIMLVDANVPEVITIPVSSVGYATTYYSDKNLVVPEGVEAYTYKVADGKLTVSSVYESGDVIPQGTGVVLKAAEGNYDFEVSDEGGFVDGDNLLRGTDEPATISESGYKYYMLSLNAQSDPNSVGFYWGKNSNNGTKITNGAHKAYLAVPTGESTTGGNAGAKSFFLFNEEDITDGIDNVQSAEFKTQSTEIYNLNGQRVNTPQRGIYIVNGRKVVVK